MIWFFRYCYYGVYQFNKSRGWERPDEKAFVWMGLTRILIYGSILIFAMSYYSMINLKINRFWGAIILMAVELIISNLINGKEKHEIIEMKFNNLSVRLQSLFTYLGLLLFPLAVICFLALGFYYRTLQGW